MLHNKCMHQTKGGGVPASQAVVEAPFAGDARCSTDPVDIPVALIVGWASRLNRGRRP